MLRVGRRPLREDRAAVAAGVRQAWGRKAALKPSRKKREACWRARKASGDRIFTFGIFPGGLFGIARRSAGFGRFAAAVREERESMRRHIRFHAGPLCLDAEAGQSCGRCPPQAGSPREAGATGATS